MKKSIYILLVLIVLTICFTGLVSCVGWGGSHEKNSGEHTHSFSVYLYNNDATCITDGTETASCDIAGCDKEDIRTKEGTATGIHSYNNYVYNNDATCDSDGTETARCKYCDNTSTRNKRGSAHSVVNYVFNNDALCGSDGTETGECLICHETVTRVKLGSATGKHIYNDYLCALCNHIAPEAPFTDGLSYYLLSEANVYEVYGSSVDSSKFIKIPAEKDGIPVVYIGAFKGYSNIISIEIPNSVTIIKRDAFSGFSGLMSIVIPNTVTSIGDYAFQGCSNLTSIEIPNSVMSIGNSAFSGCSSLTSITIPNSVTSIGESVFSDCCNLTSIEIPNSVTSIGSSAFSGCSSLTSIEIPNSVTSIEYQTFDDCINLSSIEISSSVTSIGSCAFWNCESLTSIEIPNSVTSIGGCAFGWCESLTIYCKHAEKPSGWAENWNHKSYNHYSHGPVIWDCKNNDQDEDGCAYMVADGIRYCLLNNETAWIIRQSTSVSGEKIIPETVTYKGKIYRVTTIDNEAFVDCRCLTSVVIPDSIEDISLFSFTGGCNSLTLYCEPDKSPSGWHLDSSLPAVWDCKNNDKDEDGNAYSIINGIRYMLKDGIATVITQPNNIRGAVTIPSNVIYQNETYSVTRVDDYAFNGRVNALNLIGLTSITIPKSVTSIGDYAFYNCVNLTNIDIPDSVSSIGNRAFMGSAYSNNKSNWTNNVLYLGRHLIMAGNITGHYGINKGTLTIASGAFEQCWNMTSIDIPNTVKSIGSRAFHSCSSLTSVTIPISVTNIGDSAFMHCSALTSVDIPNSITSIGDEVFSNCISLSYIDIPNRVKNIGNEAFAYCHALESVDMPNSVTSIGDSAFKGCSSLTSIAIPNSVTSIGRGAFQGCSSLIKAVFENNTGWSVHYVGYISINNADLSNMNIAANLLINTYNNYWWIRED